MGGRYRNYRILSISFLVGVRSVSRSRLEVAQPGSWQELFFAMWKNEHKGVPRRSVERDIFGACRPLSVGLRPVTSLSKTFLTKLMSTSTKPRRVVSLSPLRRKHFQIDAL